jgi:hypothetical protein
MCNKTSIFGMNIKYDSTLASLISQNWANTGKSKANKAQ